MINLVKNDKNFLVLEPWTSYFGSFFSNHVCLINKIYMCLLYSLV